MHRHVLITGGAGFVGSALALALRQIPGLEVTALDNLRRRGSERNLPRLSAGGVRFVHGDVRSWTDLAAVHPEPDLIVVCSAEPSAQAGYGGSPEYLVHTNLIGGCFHCLELARRSKADVLFVSTSRVYPYGQLNGVPFAEQDTRFALAQGQISPGCSEHGVSEDFPLDGPRSLYGMTKLAAELAVEEYADAYGFRFLINRSGLLTGPRQMAKSDQGVIALWVAAHHFSAPLSYIGFGGSGKQVRDFLHIDDFCDLAVDQVRQFEKYAGRRFNVGGGVTNSLSLLEATSLCRTITGREITIGSRPGDRPADVRVYITDHRAVSAVNGWRPQRGGEETLSDIHHWLISEGEGLRVALGW